MKTNDVRVALRAQASPEKARILARFFKTGPGDYGEGDVFIGVVVPAIRKVARQFRDADAPIVHGLLRSPVHEERLLALLILMLQYASGDAAGKRAVYRTYLGNTRYINNWDLVDVTCRDIVGAFLWERDRAPLYRLARSGNLWERRIAIVSTYYFIRRNAFEDTIRIAEILLDDPHDLIHKACGWMLREVYKRDHRCTEAFVEKHYARMPRTMLRYAIERVPEKKRKAYLRRDR